MAKKEKKTSADSTQTMSPGVYITRRGETEKMMAFQGKDFEAQLTPTGDIAVIEMVPDVGGSNGGNPVPRIRQFIAEGTWNDVVVVD